MSDCTIPMATYRASRVTVEFADAEPWSYPIAERGEVTAVTVDGTRYERVVHCADCRYRHIRHCDMTGEYVQLGDYCSFGEAG